MEKFLIGKGYYRSVMVYVEVDLSRNTELTGNFMIPTKQSILSGVGNVYYSCCLLTAKAVSGCTVMTIIMSNGKARCTTWTRRKSMMFW